MTTNIVEMVVTAYCACTICCGKHARGLTANGKPPIEGHTIAASRRLVYGTTIIINGHAYKIEDRLAKRYDDRVDIYIQEHSAAKHWGKQTLRVTIITPTSVPRVK